MKKNHINKNQKEYWRSLDQLADTPDFQGFLQREFPEHASEMTNPVTRRKFLGLMGASIAFAGLASCRRPVEKIVPYVKQPENIIPGKAKFYATNMSMGRHALGLVVESHEGRPTKIEGNKNHPLSLGKTNIFAQAEILNMYDPDRSQDVSHEGKTVEWNDFVTYWKKQYSSYKKSSGEGLAVISGEISSPTLHRLYQTFVKTFPKAIWSVNESVSYRNQYKGIKAASGQDILPSYSYDKARVVLSFDHDFLGTAPDSVKSNMGFATARRVENENDEMNRLYMLESSFSTTGGMADHRLQLSQMQIEGFARQVAAAFGLVDDAPVVVNEKWVSALVKDLKAHSGESLIVAGFRQSASVHALVYSLNAQLGNVGKTVFYHTSPYYISGAPLEKLSKALDSGTVKTVIALDANPVYDAPVDFKMRDKLSKIDELIVLSSHMDETARLAKWHIPLSHFLESWADVCSVDGTMGITQPLIRPLYKTQSITSFLNILATGNDKSDFETVKDTWKGLLKTVTLGKPWRRVLHDGVWKDAPSTIANSKSNKVAALKLINELPRHVKDLSANNLEVVVHASATMYDGHYANNGWMMECPDPVTKLAWDNAALIGPETAKELGVHSEDVVTLKINGIDFKTVVFIMPGQAKYVLSLELGYGRSGIGRIANDAGFNVNSIRTSENNYSVRNVSLWRSTNTYPLANTQDHGSMEGRPIVREATLEKYKEEPNFAPEMVEMPELKALFDQRPYDTGNQWGMAIDLNTCTGCNTCVVACQSENNIPIVGKEQVKNGREMHWIRLDRYFAGEADNPEIVFQPVACHQCENAPCEQVCPVQATQHDKEGLNVMTYNRCIGTRYCSNNCPYKVRRFNFFNYTNELPETVKMAQNPDVTVRFRGVMEKCTYCTQRIQRGKIAAKNESRELVDGDIVTACQQACPADAIAFGNILDKNSKVYKWKKQNRDYKMLAELDIRPRTSFLAKLRNPNPEMEKITKTVS